MPKLSVFPKCYMDELCVTKTMTLHDWIDLAATLGVDGMEMYPGFFANFEPDYIDSVRRHVESKGMTIPMMCCSPDFTQHDAAARQAELDKERFWIDLTARLGGSFCRVLSGQRREDVSRADGVRYTVECINEVIPYAAERNIVLNMENHYKDGYWKYPEFAQHLDVFLEVINQIDSPWFGVNFDPSNSIICGEDPLEVLAAVRHRVVSMHASDRYLISGTLADLKKQDGSMGYAKNLKHGVIGKGMNDYDAIFSTLRAEGFDSWISIEDGENGMEELKESVRFLREKIARHFD
ncbi:MAG: sugar phosphate isomerase/epimerase family protein [Blastocatellia bacterium]